MWLYHGGFAEYVCTRGTAWALKPRGLTFEQAAAIPQAGVIALKGIREHGHVQPGQHVLINGAGGGAGSFAAQLAKLDGAEVTGVDNTGKLDFLRSLGADQIKPGGIPQHSSQSSAEPDAAVSRGSVD